MSRWERIRAWELAYTRYAGASDDELPPVSRAVATAWRDLAAEVPLPAWARAAVISAAEAFEIQADRWETRLRRGESVRGHGARQEAGRGESWVGRVRRDVDRRVGSGTDGRGDWFGPDASPDAGARGGAVRGDAAAAGRPGDVAGVLQVPSRTPRQRGGHGGAPRSPRDGSAGA